MKEGKIFFLVLIFVLIIKFSISAAVNFNVILFKTDMTIMQGHSNSTNVRFHNLLNDTLIFVTLKFDKPANMEITTSPIEYTDLWSNSFADFYIKISANESLENGTYSVKFWLDSGSDVQSDKYTINITIVENPLLVNITTTTIDQTTTSTIQSGSSNLTTALTSSIGETTTQTTIKSEKPKFKKEYLIFLAIIVIGLFIIPYSTFKK